METIRKFKYLVYDSIHNKGEFAAVTNSLALARKFLFVREIQLYRLNKVRPETIKPFVQFVADKTVDTEESTKEKMKLMDRDEIEEIFAPWLHKALWHCRKLKTKFDIIYTEFHEDCNRTYYSDEYRLAEGKWDNGLKEYTLHRLENGDSDCICLDALDAEYYENKSDELEKKYNIEDKFGFWEL